jgi:predicted RNA-binding protein YlqC (UPF0109 family)
MNDCVYNAEDAETLRQLIIGIAKSLVDHPERVTVTTRQDTSLTTLTLIVSPDDLGKVIGKQGRTARSIRTILGAACMKVHHLFHLDIAETA